MTWRTIRFMWNCPWRIEWRRQFEYWDRCQFGPFYMLLPPTRNIQEEEEGSDAD